MTISWANIAKTLSRATGIGYHCPPAMATTEHFVKLKDATNELRQTSVEVRRNARNINRELAAIERGVRRK